MHWIASLIAMLAVVGASPASAQTYPTKPIHILVPYAPGGITDIAARIVGAKLTEAWGQQVVVENKPGGNGFIAMTAVAKARARRLHAGDGDGRRHRDQPGAVQEHAVRRAARLGADRAGERRSDGARRQRQFAVQDRGRRHRRRQGAARADLGRHARQRQRQPASCWSGWRSTPAPSSSTSPTRAALRRRPHSPAAISRSRSSPVRRSRPHAKSGRARVLAVTGAKPSKFNPEWPTLQKEGVPGRRCVELDCALCAQGHAAADHRQAQRRGGEDPQHAGRQGPLRGRRRRDHPVEPGRTRCPREGGGRALQDHRRQGQHQAGLSDRGAGVLRREPHCGVPGRGARVALRSARRRDLDALRR